MVKVTRMPWETAATVMDELLAADTGSAQGNREASRTRNADSRATSLLLSWILYNTTPCAHCLQLPAILRHSHRVAGRGEVAEHTPRIYRLHGWLQTTCRGRRADSTVGPSARGHLYGLASALAVS